MARMNLDHWFISEDQLSISLMRFYVSIDLVNKLDKKTAVLRVSEGSGGQDIWLSFNTIEEAVVFTENTVNKCVTLQEVLEGYKNVIAKQAEQSNKKGSI